MLEQSYVLALVIASLAVSLMGSFTGLSLTYGINALPGAQRKLSVAMAAIALGGGIWSMHFVAMLGLELPVLFYYDALTTLISALVAILMVGIALLLMHFRARTPRGITAAGAIVGLGIAAMHYLGMSGMQLCRPVYSPVGFTLAWGASIGLGIVSFHVIYGARSRRNVFFGTLCLGLSVFAVHFIAMGGTGFLPDASGSPEGPLLDNATLAMVVTLAAFVICGAFLLTGVTFLPSGGAAAGEEARGAPDVRSVAAASAKLPQSPAALSGPSPEGTASPLAAPPVSAHHPEAAAMAEPARPPGPRQGSPSLIPYEKDGRTIFVERAKVAALRAEGHYTILYVGGQELFCPWSISEAEARLADPGFVRAHRSYLINVSHVTGFERHKDNGICFFEKTVSLGKVTVSRSRLPAVRDALGV
ncbi:MHYT domain-containing protein [Aurantimonas sp. 22II-16-19i]|uniref:MHYT domain-containing protein n=1 Tax=Aurantimonas sp. 22II-16-19i TaxID=1317114 RepID=UPI0009F7B108|nr:MHYT domain-containing protein [Aurantimonas sp. 22II-16-19i]ORE88148.1 putative integral membrane sensor protein [Aurantimonas sp. 22II-16-19i]